MKADFSSRLRQVRTESDLTLEECARLLGTTKSAIWRYEAGENVPSIDFVMRVSSVFRISADWLSGLSESREIRHLLEKELLEVYERLSGEGRKKVISYAKYILHDEKDGDES